MYCTKGHMREMIKSQITIIFMPVRECKLLTRTVHVCACTVLTDIVTSFTSLGIGPQTLFVL